MAASEDQGRTPAKTVSSEAPLPLPDICARALAQRKVTEARSQLAAGEAWMGSGLVLTTRYGTPIDPRNFQRFFQARAAKAEVPVIPVHELGERAQGQTRRA